MSQGPLTDLTLALNNSRHAETTARQVGSGYRMATASPERPGDGITRYG
jgi:hypothetical protein